MTQREAIENLVEGAHRWRASLEEDGWTDAEIRNIARPGVAQIYEAICELERRQ